MRHRVLHLVGSPVSDFFQELSLLYARDCLSATADPDRWEPVLALVSPDGSWRFPTDLGPAALAATPRVSVDYAVRHLLGLRLHIAVPQMFCVPGMTTYRSLLDLLGIPFVGNDAETMALAAHKGRARAVVAAAGVAVPPGEVLRAGQRATLPPPVVVKPVDGDNSVGTSLVRDPADLEVALSRALAHSEQALVERYVELGREVRCGVLVQGRQLVCLPLEEYAVNGDHPIRGYDDKISRTPNGDLRLVAKNTPRAWIVDPDDPVTAAVWQAARACHVALGCRDYSLFDFRIDPAGRPWFLEAGLYCSFATTSVLSVMAGAAGIALPTLFRQMVEPHLGREGDDGAPP